jgi:hypothetical protein
MRAPEGKSPKCRTDNAPDDSFCRKRGHDLRKAVESPPIDHSKPQSHTAKFLAEKILTTRSSIEGERKLVTVLFADVANYTSMAWSSFTGNSASRNSSASSSTP